MAELRRGLLEVGGGRSPIVESGPDGVSEAVVFIHGNPGSHEDWLELVGEAGEFARALAWDMPDFGRSTAPARFGYTPQDYGDFLGGSLQQLGVERVHLVVHDFGGPWAWAWAADHTDLLASVVAINTGMLDGRKWHKIAQMWRRPVQGELLMALTSRRRFDRVMTGAGAVPLPSEFLDRIWSDYDRRTKRAVLKLYRATDLPWPDGARWVEALAERDPPAMIVFGDSDPALPSEPHIRRLKKGFPSAEVRHLPESGHFPFADDPDGTAAAVIPFLQAQAGGRRLAAGGRPPGRPG